MWLSWNKIYQFLCIKDIPRYYYDKNIHLTTKNLITKFINNLQCNERLRHFKLCTDKMRYWSRRVLNYLQFFFGLTKVSQKGIGSIFKALSLLFKMIFFFKMQIHSKTNWDWRFYLLGRFIHFLSKHFIQITRFLTQNSKDCTKAKERVFWKQFKHELLSVFTWPFS